MGPQQTQAIPIKESFPDPLGVQYQLGLTCESNSWAKPNTGPVVEPYTLYTPQYHTYDNQSARDLTNFCSVSNGCRDTIESQPIMPKNLLDHWW